MNKWSLLRLGLGTHQMQTNAVLCHGDCWPTHWCSQLMVDREQCCVELLKQHRAISLLPTACVLRVSGTCYHDKQRCRRNALQTLKLLSTAVFP
jgi:hypothetical protein